MVGSPKTCAWLYPSTSVVPLFFPIFLVVLFGKIPTAIVGLLDMLVILELWKLQLLGLQLALAVDSIALEEIGTFISNHLVPFIPDRELLARRMVKYVMD